MQAIPPPPAETAPTRVVLPDLAATRRVGAALGRALGPGDALMLTGGLGVGKSELARAAVLARYPAGEGPGEVPSPTWTLAQIYDTPQGEIWHVDLYRLGDPSEAEELGLGEALGESACLVEWPERLGSLAPWRALTAALDFAGAGEGRTLTLTPRGGGWEAAVSAAVAAADEEGRR